MDHCECEILCFDVILPNARQQGRHLRGLGSRRPPRKKKREKKERKKRKKEEKRKKERREL